MRPYANDKNIRWRIAEAAIMLDGIQPQINELSDTLESSTEYSFIWLPRLSSIKNRSVEVSKKAVEEIVRASGGSSYFNRTNYLAYIATCWLACSNQVTKSHCMMRGRIFS